MSLPLPVRARNVHVVLFQQPVIERIMSQQKAGDPILPDQPKQHRSDCNASKTMEPANVVNFRLMFSPGSFCFRGPSRAAFTSMKRRELLRSRRGMDSPNT